MASPATTYNKQRTEVWPLLLLFAAGLINFLDRSSLGVAAACIHAELHLTATQIGALLSIFSLAYGLAQLPLAGFLRPRNAAKTLGLGLLLWSAAQAASGAVHSFGSFLALRVVLGAGESPFYPAGVHLVRQSAVPGQRGRATAVLNLSSTLGLAIAPPLLTALLLRFGWRSMFVALGGAGALLALLWLLNFSGAIPHSEERIDTAMPFAKLLRQPSMWGMMLGFGGLNYVNWFFISWLPGYLESGRHLSTRSSGWLAATPFLAGACGAVASGLFADARAGSGKPRESLHRTNIIVGLLCCSASTALVESASTAVGAVVMIAIAMFCLQYAGTSGWGLVQAMVPSGNVAAASALQNFGSFMIASLAPLATGWLLDRTRSFGLALLLCAGMAAAGALFYATLTRRPMHQPQTNTQEF